VYGSIIDLYPARAELRRFSGERLERVGGRDPSARLIAIETYRRAVADRPDHLTGHRLLAYAHVRAGDFAAGFAAILAAVDRAANGADRIITEDAAMIAAAYIAAGGPRDSITVEMRKRLLSMSAPASVRSTMALEPSNPCSSRLKNITTSAREPGDRA
jgi:hypothetical protein